MTYQELTSEKYRQASAKAEIAQLKKEQTSSSVKAFIQFMVAYLVIAGSAYLLNQNPEWLPAMFTYFGIAG